MAYPQISGEFGVVSDPMYGISQKGNAWIKLRGKSADRVKDSMGNWTDSEPLYINILCSGKAAEHLIDSIAKGDTIIANGKLKNRKYTNQDGIDSFEQYIDAESIGVSTRWTPAPTPRYKESIPSKGSGSVEEPSSESSNDTDAAPF